MAFAAVRWLGVSVAVCLSRSYIVSTVTFVYCVETATYTAIVAMERDQETVLKLLKFRIVSFSMILSDSNVDLKRQDILRNPIAQNGNRWSSTYNGRPVVSCTRSINNWWRHFQ